MMTQRTQTKTRRRHSSECRCWRCYANVLGEFLDGLGTRTEAGRWVVFLTITLAVNPVVGFGRLCFDKLVAHLSTQLGTRVEYVVAEQYGERHGRFHLHALIAARGLETYSLREIENWLRIRAGWSRALPFQQGAAYYIAKYIGGNLATADWRVEVGPTGNQSAAEIGRTVIAPSATLPSDLFHQTLRTRKR